MTWRAFLIGLATVAAFSYIDPRAAIVNQYGALNSTSFPAGVVLVLVGLSLGANVLIKLLRREWALRRAELMLVWCMMICAATVPTYGIGRFLYPLIAGPPYQARRADVFWEDGGALTHAPAGLLLSKNPRSEAVRRYHEGSPEGAGVPWGQWVRPLARWGVFLLLLYLGVFCMCAILRRQWVEVERLMFPLARVPLEFSEGSAGRDLLPAIFRDRAFLAGLAVAGGFRLLRALPAFWGAEGPIPLSVPLRDIFAGTPLEHARFQNITFWPRAMGFAFLVPADVSLSVWVFFLFGRLELAASHWLAMPSAGGEHGPLMTWQQAGAFFAFAASLLYMARRHLAAVVRKALWLDRAADDSEEPVGYRLAAWGFAVSLVGCLAWYWWFGMRLSTGAAMLALLFCSYLIYARVVCQGGVHVLRTTWTARDLLHGFSGGHLFGGPGAVIASTQWTLLVTGGSVALAPMAMNSFRISEVFGRKRRWLVPVCMLAILVALVFAGHNVLTCAYDRGALNFSDPWGQQQVPRWRFAEANSVIRRPFDTAQAHVGPFALGAAGMAFLTFMRTRFYWWPIHSLGLLACSGWHAQRLWLPFLCGWLVKVLLMRFGGGRRLRRARTFFIALIVVEACTEGLVAILRTATGGAVPAF
ncbi:MAG: DUF6785 family protein [Planctomycetota bacterium]